MQSTSRSGIGRSDANERGFRVLPARSAPKVIGYISGSINAGGTIVIIARDVGQLPDVSEGVVRPKPRRIAGAAGDITGAISAGGSIGLIHAFGDLGLVNAGGALPEVEVGGDATGTIDALGVIDADVWGSTQQPILATDNIDLHVYETRASPGSGFVFGVETV